MVKKINRKNVITSNKPSHKGKKAMRGEPLVYDEVKVKLNLTITPTAKSLLKSKAESEQCSISSLLEELARSTLLNEFHVASNLKSSVQDEKN